jgi:hypothetical protein
MGGHDWVPRKHIEFVATTYISCLHPPSFVFNVCLRHLNAHVLEGEAECLSLNSVKPLYDILPPRSYTPS